MTHLCLLVIKLYQYVISPWIGPCCRFEPSCSQFAWTAVQRYGVSRGCLLAIMRLLKCHPFHPGGMDPVP